jgi:5-methylcytosine-specific restriction endonuclease McrA
MVAGSEFPARKATSALKDALRIHGGKCFYCPASAERVSAQLNVDHIDAVSRGKCDLLHNLVVSCKDCNLKKGALPIEAFHPNAGRTWLLAVQALIRARLQLIPDDDEG